MSGRIFKTINPKNMKKNLLFDKAGRKEFKKEVRKYIGVNPLLGFAYEKLKGPKPTSAWAKRFIEAGGIFHGSNPTDDMDLGLFPESGVLLEQFGVSPEVAGEYVDKYLNYILIPPALFKEYEEVPETVEQLAEMIEFVWYETYNQVA